MIRIGEKYINPAAVKAVEPRIDPNWSQALVGNDWIILNAPAAVVADRVQEALNA